MCPALSPRPFASSPHRFSGGEDGRERDVIGSILTSARAAAHGRYGWNMTKALGSESPVDREVESTCQATYPTPDKGKHRSQLEGRPRYGRHRPPTKSGYHRTRSKTAYQRGTQRNRRSSISTEPKSPINANACSLPSPRPTRATSDCSRRVTANLDRPRYHVLTQADNHLGHIVEPVTALICDSHAKKLIPEGISHQPTSHHSDIRSRTTLPAPIALSASSRLSTIRTRPTWMSSSTLRACDPAGATTAKSSARVRAAWAASRTTLVTTVLSIKDASARSSTTRVP